MNIDLLFTAQGEAGLLSDENFFKKVAGVIFDPLSHLVSLEYIDGDHMETNIPVEPEFYDALDFSPLVHIGSCKGGVIAQAYQVPLAFLGDLQRTQLLGSQMPPENPLAAFNFFLKRCVTGQPIYRPDLGNESSMGCVLGDANPASLQFAPHLARRIALENAQAMKLAAAARGPSGPGGPGGMGGGGSTIIQGGSFRWSQGGDDKTG